MSRFNEQISTPTEVYLARTLNVKFTLVKVTFLFAHFTKTIFMKYIDIKIHSKGNNKREQNKSTENRSKF